MNDFAILNQQATISKMMLEKGIQTFSEACIWVENLPYERVSDKENLELVILENRGTCSTKHGLLKRLAEENRKNEIELCIGIYKMNGQNTIGIGSILSKHQVAFIPEAHCYLKVEGKRYDFTGLGGDIAQIEKDLMEEIVIDADQTGQWKSKYHKNFLQKWLIEHQLPFSFDVFWQIRELCIERLSKA